MSKQLKVYIVILISSYVVHVPNLRAQEQERDPFVSIIDLQEQEIKAEKIKVDLSNVVLKGIIWSNSRAIAIINEELAMLGDNWGGFKVESIDKDSVTLTREGRSYKLFVEEAIPTAEKKEPTTKVQEPSVEERRGYPTQEMGYPEKEGFYPEGNFRP